jgi:hypothetical protein
MRAALADWEAKTEDMKPAERTPDEFDRLTGLPTPARVRPRPSKAEMAAAKLAAAKAAEPAAPETASGKAKEDPDKPAN